MSSTRYEIPAVKPPWTFQRLIQATYHPIETKYLIRAVSDLAHKDDIEKDQKEENKQNYIYNESYPWGQSPPPQNATAILNHYESTSLDDTALSYITSTSFTTRDIGLAYSKALMEFMEVITIYLTHSTGRIRASGNSILYNYLWTNNGNQLNHELKQSKHIKIAWILRFTDLLRDYLIVKESSRDKCSNMKNAILETTVAVLDILMDIRVNCDEPNDNIRIKKEDIDRHLQKWLNIIYRVGSHTTAVRIASTIISSWPSFAIGALIINESEVSPENSLDRICDILENAICNVSNELKSSKYMPECLITLLSYYSKIYDVEMRKTSDLLMKNGNIKRFWNLMDTVIKTFEGRANYSETTGVINTTLFALWNLTDFIAVNEDGSKVLLGKGILETMERRSIQTGLRDDYVKDQMNCIMNFQSCTSATVIIDSNALRLIRILIFCCLVQLEESSGASISHSILALNDLLTLCILVTGMDKCTCKSTDMESKECFCPYIPKLVILIHEKIPTFVKCSVTPCEDPVFENDEKDDVLLALILISMTTEKINDTSHFEESLLQAQTTINEAIDNILFFDESRKAISELEETIALQSYCTYAMYVSIGIEEYFKHTENMSVNDDVLSPNSERRLKKIYEKVVQLWSMPTESAWRSKHQVIMILMRLVHISIVTKRDFGMINITRIALEAMLYPVAIIRIASHSLLRLIGRHVVYCDPDDIGTMLIAPILMVLKGSMALKTVGDIHGVNRKRWNLWRLNWHGGAANNTGDGIGIFLHRLKTENPHTSVLFKFYISAYKSLGSILIGLHEGCLRDKQKGKTLKKRLNPLMETVEASIEAGFERETSKFMQDVLRDSITETLQLWRSVKCLEIV